MISPRYFYSIKVDLPFQAVLRRLGYNKKEARLSAGEEKEIFAEAEAAAESLGLAGAVLRCPLEREGEAGIIAEGFLWESRDLRRVLDGCREAFLLAATGGPAFQERLDGLMARGEMRRAVIWNAAASELVDEVLDWLTVLLKRELVREGKTTARHRFSPGYGDLPLDYQEDFYRLLDLGTLGITLTSAKLMVPEKSVTAVLGILEREKEGLCVNER